jgi:hypothetical protein
VTVRQRNAHAGSLVGGPGQTGAINGPMCENLVSCLIISLIRTKGEWHTSFKCPLNVHAYIKLQLQSPDSRAPPCWAPVVHFGAA